MPLTPALGLDVLQNAARDDAAARRDVTAGVELEDAELAREELGRRARELVLDELQQLGRHDRRRDEVRVEVGQDSVRRRRAGPWRTSSP